MNKINIVFFGTPDFALPTLELLSHHPAINIKYVITMPDRPKSRGLELTSPPVAQFAKERKLPLLQTENINKENIFIENLKSQSIDAFVVLAFAQFLGSSLLAIPKLGAYNIHTSLLPKYRGAAPINYALLNGDTSTGVSIQRMVKKMDAGDIVLSKEVAIHPKENYPMLYSRLKFQAALSCSDFISQLTSSSVCYTVQDESKVSFAPEIPKEMGHLKFKTSTSKEIVNCIRALNPWPSTFAFINNLRMKIIEVQPSNHSNIEPGLAKIINGQLIVGVLDGALRLSKIQPEGKRMMNDFDFIHGIKNIDQIILT